MNSSTSTPHSSWPRPSSSLHYERQPRAVHSIVIETARSSVHNPFEMRNVSPLRWKRPASPNYNDTKKLKNKNNRKRVKKDTIVKYKIWSDKQGKLKKLLDKLSVKNSWPLCTCTTKCQTLVLLFVSNLILLFVSVAVFTGGWSLRSLFDAKLPNHFRLALNVDLTSAALFTVTYSAQLGSLSLVALTTIGCGCGHTFRSLLLTYGLASLLLCTETGYALATGLAQLGEHIHRELTTGFRWTLQNYRTDDRHWQALHAVQLLFRCCGWLSVNQSYPGHRVPVSCCPVEWNSVSSNSSSLSSVSIPLWRQWCPKSALKLSTVSTCDQMTTVHWWLDRTRTVIGVITGVQVMNAVLAVYLGFGFRSTTVYIDQTDIDDED